MIGSHRLIGFFDFSAPFARGCSSYIAIAAARVPAILTARAVNIADYQAFTEKSFADAGKPWQSSAIGDGKLCLTAGKPQSGAACGKSAAINYVPRSGTTMFDVFDADILCGIRFSAGFAALHQRLSIVKHLWRFHRNIYNHLIVSNINRLRGQSEWFVIMFRDF